MKNRYPSPYDLSDSYKCEQPKTHVEKAKESYEKMFKGLGYAAASPVIAAAMVSAEPGQGRFSVNIKKRKFIPSLFAAVPTALVTTTVAAGVAVATAITSPFVLGGAAIKDKVDEYRGPGF